MGTKHPVYLRLSAEQKGAERGLIETISSENSRVSSLVFLFLLLIYNSKRARSTTTKQPHSHLLVFSLHSYLPRSLLPLFPDLLLFLQLHYHPLSFCTSLSVAVQFRESTAVSFLFFVQPPLERKKDTNRQQCDTKIAMRPDENDDDNDNDSMMYSRANKSSCRSFGSLCRSFGCKKLKSL